jgi:MerR family redox-sensitive transcriptional activator SoxR
MARLKPEDLGRLLSVGEVAQRSGVAVSTIHFYESKGLIASWRSEGNQRRYPRAVLRWVAIVKVAQRAGIPLATIREALDTLPKGVPPTAEDWGRLSAHWRNDLDQRIRRLTQLDVINSTTSCIGCGCVLSIKILPHLRGNPGPTSSRSKGPGPRLLDMIWLPCRLAAWLGCRRTRLVLLFGVGVAPPHDGIRGRVELSFGRSRCRLTAETADVADSPIHRPRGDTALPEQTSRAQKLSWRRSGCHGGRGFVAPAEVGLVDPHAM